MASSSKVDATSGTSACSDHIARLVRTLETNTGTHWAALRDSLKGNDVAKESSDLGETVIQEGVLISTNLLTALKGSVLDARFTPDPAVLRQYQLSLPVERKRLAAWKQQAGNKPVAPLRKILEMYDQQLLELSNLKTVIACLEKAETPAPAPEVVSNTDPPDAPLEPRGDDQHVVLLVHGIRTEADWQDRIASLLRKAGVNCPQPFKYGYFDLFQFLTPGTVTRHIPSGRLHRQLRSISMQRPQAKLTVIAHSFGTVAICRLLQEFPDLVLHRLILCGSVVPLDYPWDRVRLQVQNRVLNECGVQDIWPRLAAACTWGYGPTGATGFGNFDVCDRFHPGRHSDFFNDKFVTMYWLPFILYGEIPESDFERTRQASPRLHRFVGRLPLRWMIVSLMAALTITVLGFASVGIWTWLHWPASSS
jgi:pimeloyl-ACP methyl ester carboxylesterase